jgi:Ni/Fe-hydrogenase subunit HybB-like protein
VAKHGLLLPESPGTTVPMSVFWMAPQYATDVGRMDFLYKYDQAPESVRSSAVALYWQAMSAGSYMGMLLVMTVRERTKGEGKWLQPSGQPQQRESRSVQVIRLPAPAPQKNAIDTRWRVFPF